MFCDLYGSGMCRTHTTDNAWLILWFAGQFCRTPCICLDMDAKDKEDTVDMEDTAAVIDPVCES